MNDPRFELSEKEHEEFCQQATELESIHQEQADLKIQGKLDSVAKERLDARMQKISERIEKQVDAQLAAALASYVPPKTFVLPKSVKILGLSLASFVFIGAALEFFIGSTFVFSLTNEYRSIRHWMFFCYLPIFIVALYFFEKEVVKPTKYDTTFVLRWAFIYPIALAISSGMVVVCPLGYAALSGWVIGRESNNLEGNILSIGKAYPESYGCKQRGQLEYEGVDATICIDGLIHGEIPKPDSAVILKGRKSHLGLYVEKIQEK